MTNRTNDTAINANAAAASRYAAETNAMTFTIPQAPRRTGKVRSTGRRKRRALR